MMTAFSAYLLLCVATPQLVQLVMLMADGPGFSYEKHGR